MQGIYTPNDVNVGVEAESQCMKQTEKNKSECVIPSDRIIVFLGWNCSDAFYHDIYIYLDVASSSAYATWNKRVYICGSTVSMKK